MILFDAPPSVSSKVLLHMSLGNKESHDGWLEHFRSLVSRGMPTPLWNAASRKNAADRK